MHSSIRLLSAASALSLVAAAGCSDATGTGAARSLSLSFSTLPSTGASASLASLSVSASSAPLVVTKAQLVISKSELARSGATCTSSSSTSSDEQECPELKLGPMLVDLPLDASAKGVLAVPLPAGTYEQLESKIDAVMDETEGDPAASAAFLAANPDFRGVSVRVEGTYDGQPFVYTTAAEGELELTFDPPLVVDGSSSNLTVNVDLSSWFRRSDGTTIDPNTATPGSATKEIVDDNIKRSFDVFEDDDRDGQRD
jgi:hypothetical protein